MRSALSHILPCAKLSVFENFKPSFTWQFDFYYVSQSSMSTALRLKVLKEYAKYALVCIFNSLSTFSLCVLPWQNPVPLSVQFFVNIMCILIQSIATEEKHTHTNTHFNHGHQSQRATKCYLIIMIHFADSVYFQIFPNGYFIPFALSSNPQCLITHPHSQLPISLKHSMQPWQTFHKPPPLYLPFYIHLYPYHSG